MDRRFWSACLIAFSMALNVASPAHAQAGPYDRAKALALAANIEGVKIGMPIEQARQVLSSAGYVTPPKPTVAGGRYAGRAVPPPCSSGQPPVEELRYTFPNVPSHFRELRLKYDCASQRVVNLSINLAEAFVQKPGAPFPTVEGAPMFPQAKRVYEELCGSFAQPDARELNGPRELNASLRCIVTINSAFAAMTKVENGVHYLSSVNVGLQGSNLYGYSRALSGVSVR
jgi:hypothetical protein